MLTVDDYGRIRRAHRDGMSIRAIARMLHRSRRKIRQVLAEPEPKPYTRVKEPLCPVLGPYQAIINEILQQDDQSNAPRKQRHTAAKIFRRLKEEHSYQGSYIQIRRFVREHKRGEQRISGTFIPLNHDPGQRLECDFGHVVIQFPEGRQQVPVLQVVWSFSGHRFSIGLPSEKVEAILEGMVQAFEFFVCVAREVWWDNPKTVALKILKGRQREIHPRYQALASHYLFDPMFCMPARGNEKPYVENSVFDLQRDWCTPVPCMKDLVELNAYLRKCCIDRMGHTVSGQRETVEKRFEQDKSAAFALVPHHFEPCVYQNGKVDKYQTVRHGTNRYSVPRRWAFETVRLKIYVDKIRVVASDTVIATHERCYDKHCQILDPVHYLAILGRRPAGLDHSNVFKDWKLPVCFRQLRNDLEHRHGALAGSRHFILVLQLLAENPVQRVSESIEYHQGRQSIESDLIVQRVNHKKAVELSGNTLLDISSSIPGVTVPKPTLIHFDTFLTGDQKGVSCYG